MRDRWCPNLGTTRVKGRPQKPDRLKRISEGPAYEFTVWPTLQLSSPPFRLNLCDMWLIRKLSQNLQTTV